MPDVTFDDLIPKTDEGQGEATPESPDIAFDDLIPERPGIGEGLARSVGQGLTFGFGDEIEASFRSLFGEETYREAGASGAVAGAGQAEGNENIVPGMIRGGATGAVTGAAFPTAAQAMRPLARKAGNIIPSRLIFDALRKRAGRPGANIPKVAGSEMDEALARAWRGSRQFAKDDSRRKLADMILRSMGATAASGTAQGAAQ